MPKSPDIDFGEVLMLMNLIVECGKHGPAYTKIGGAAQARLKEIEESFGEPLPAKVEAQKKPTPNPVPVKPFGRNDDDDTIPSRRL